MSASKRQRPTEFKSVQMATLFSPVDEESKKRGQGIDFLVDASLELPLDVTFEFIANHQIILQSQTLLTEGSVLVITSNATDAVFKRAIADKLQFELGSGVAEVTEEKQELASDVKTINMSALFVPGNAESRERGKLLDFMLLDVPRLPLDVRFTFVNPSQFILISPLLQSGDHLVTIPHYQPNSHAIWKQKVVKLFGLSHMPKFKSVSLSELMVPLDDRSAERGNFRRISVASNLVLPLEASFEFTLARTPQFIVKSPRFETTQITISHSDRERMWAREIGKLLGIEIEAPTSFTFRGTVDVNADGTMTQEAITKLVADVRSKYEAEFLPSVVQ